MRTTILILVMLAVGAAVGAFAARLTLTSQLETALDERDVARKELSGVSDARQENLNELARLKAVNEALEMDLRGLRQKAEAMPVAANVFVEESDAAMEEFPPEEAMVTMEGDERGGPPDGGPGDGREGGRGERGRPRGMSEEEWAQRRQQWEEFREQRRVDRENFFANTIANAKDAATQERVAAIQEYNDYLSGLREAMRDAETDEERDQLRQDMMENGRVLQDLVEAQRDSMIRDMAAQSGITDSAKQDAFVNAYHQLQASPFFREYGGGGMIGRGGPGFGRGGR